MYLTRVLKALVSWLNLFLSFLKGRCCWPANKVDITGIASAHNRFKNFHDIIYISAKNIDDLRNPERSHSVLRCYHPALLTREYSCN